MSIFDLEGKKSKFRRINFLRMAPKNIPMCFQHSPIKTVGGVRENAKKTPKNDQFFTRTGLTLNRSTSKHIQNSYSISCAYA